MVTGAARVLAVEDDDAIRASVRASLEAENYRVLDLSDGGDIEAVMAEFQPDLAILDVRLPRGPNGFAIAQALRATSDLPILFLTAADELDDRLAGFAAGGDGHLAKPFSMAELLARVAALLRRAGRLPLAVWHYDDLVIDDAAHLVTRSGEPVELTRIEYDLLAVLIRRPGQVFSKTQLLVHVWGFDAFDTNLVEVHVSSLRRKLEAHGSRLIQTIRGVGYVLRAA